MECALPSTDPEAPFPDEMESIVGSRDDQAIKGLSVLIIAEELQEKGCWWEVTLGHFRLQNHVKRISGGLREGG